MISRHIHKLECYEGNIDPCICLSVICIIILGVSPTNCKEILKKNPEARSGVYLLWFEHKPERMLCDMETDGGGWTLVYSYKGKYVTLFKLYVYNTALRLLF